MAQPGSAFVWGTRGRGFESRHSDHSRSLIGLNLGAIAIKSFIAAAIIDLWYFGIKQAYACIFAGLMLAAILATKWLWADDFILARYDFLAIWAIAIQVVMVAFKLEHPNEIKVILIFHLVGTVMEIFKTHVGSWSYPEENFLRIGGVPLFTGFMYGAVGSYIARVWRIFEFRYTGYPPVWQTALLSVLIYLNFFTHHFTWDIRWGLFALTVLLFSRTWIYYKPHKIYRSMPLLLGFVLVSFFIWIAENLGTFAAAWTYPEQGDGWSGVSLAKMGSWFLLMIISFVLVTLVNPIETMRQDKSQPT